MSSTKTMPIATAAPLVPCSEQALRRLDRLGVVHPARDAFGRRLFGNDDVLAARKRLKRSRSILPPAEATATAP